MAAAMEADFLEYQGKYLVEERIGHGAFSVVYRAIDIKSGEKVAIKRIKSTSGPQRIINEIGILLDVGESANVAKLIGCVKEKGDVSLVMPYCPQSPFRDFYATITLAEIKFYFNGLFTALYHTHAAGVIHRDVKPSNVLFCRHPLSLQLIDFGLSQRSITEEARRARKLHLYENEHFTSKTPSRGGTRGFRAPEVLFRVSHQSTAIDMWSAGVILLSLLSGRYPFFPSPDDQTAIVELGALFGTAEMSAIALLFGQKLSFPLECPSKDLKDLCSKLQSRGNSFPDEAYHLLERLLDLNPNTRISAEEALEHPFLQEEETSEEPSEEEEEKG